MISHQEAKRRANAHLRATGSSLVVRHAARDHGVWVVSYVDPAEPDVMLDGGALVVTDAGDVHDLGSAPGSLESLLLELDRGVDELSDVYAREGEGLALLADLDPDEAQDLATWAQARHRERRGD